MLNNCHRSSKKKYGIETKYFHLYSSSLHLHREYKNCLNNGEKEVEINRENPSSLSESGSYRGTCTQLAEVSRDNIEIMSRIKGLTG